MPERARLEAVLLDAGGTLVRLDFEWMAETVSALGAPVSAEALRRAEVEGRRRYDRSRGHRPAHGEPDPPLGTIGEIREYSDTLLMFLLRAHNPKKYRENSKLDLAGSVRA